MATRKKTKAKSKAAKGAKKKRPVPAKAAKKAARKPAAKRRVAAKTAAPKRNAVPKVAAAAQPVMPPPPPGERVGTVVHYYSNLSVAIIELDTGALKVGDVIHIRGHTTDFEQPVESMEVDHVHVNEVGPGKSFGLRVKDHARENDVVYKLEKK